MPHSLRPYKKLLTKQWLILLTLSFMFFIAGLLLVLLVPLGEPTPHEVRIIVWPITLGCISLLWIICVPILALWVKNLKYEIEDDRVIIHKGILTKVRQNIPYRAITDFVLHRSLYDRFLGIASIRIQTAGQTQSATGYEGNMAGLKEWEELHQDLRSRVRSLHPISESLGIKEKVATGENAELLFRILEELKAIRIALEK
ncbi:MAG: PH domain-containing protein [Candidatus Aminicenantes bacterium]|nr:PH domain-containing protein [Candidatus Aminicenantes bacterium]